MGRLPRNIPGAIPLSAVPFCSASLVSPAAHFRPLLSLALLPFRGNCLFPQVLALLGKEAEYGIEIVPRGVMWEPPTVMVGRRLAQPMRKSI